MGHRVWDTQRNAMKRLRERLGADVSKLFNYAFGTQGSTLSYRAAQLASATVSFISPFDALFHPEKMAENAATILDQSAELAHATAGLAKHGYFFAETLPKFASLAREIKTNYEVNRRALSSIAMAVRFENKDSFTSEMARQFLENHNYSP